MPVPTKQLTFNAQVTHKYFIRKVAKKIFGLLGSGGQNSRWLPVVDMAQLTFFLLHLESQFRWLFYGFRVLQSDGDTFQVPPTTK